MKTIDSILLVLWKLIEFVVQVLLGVCFFIFWVFRSLFKFLGTSKSDHNQAQSTRSGAFSAFLWDGIKRQSSWFSGKMKDSSGFRRCSFLVFLILAILYFFPPSHWGPWSVYETGVASYYSKGFWFKRTASGERFIPLFYTAAHKKLPLGITVKVKNLENGKVVYVKINDRGPFVKGRIIDLSSAAAKKLGIYEPGTAKVAVYTRKKY